MYNISFGNRFKIESIYFYYPNIGSTSIRMGKLPSYIYRKKVKGFSMKIKSLLLTFILMISVPLYAQFTLQQVDSLKTATNIDYQLMLKQLQIDSLRSGPSGNPKTPNAANTDELKASPFTSLPDPLILNNGEKVTDAATWWKKRRPEIVEYFDREIYGRIPQNVPEVT